jgi:hypothetical protein
METNKKPPVVRRDIDENLKKVYQEILSEEVPDRFKQLLDQLRQKDLSQ